MKKFICMLALAGFSLGTFAQDNDVPVSKYSVKTNSFWANWFISAGAEFNASYPSQGRDVSANPFSSQRGTGGFNVAIGKWYTPGFGLRTKFQGLWAKKTISDDLHHSYKYWNLHENLLFNFSNLFYGYNEKRVWNFIPYIGAGIGHNVDDGDWEPTFNIGLLNNFRVSKHVQVFLDLEFMAAKGNFDEAHPDDYSNFKAYNPKHYDKMLTIAAGVTYNLGKCTWEKVPDISALVAMNKEQVDALNASLNEQQAENARLRDMLANQKTVTEVQPQTTTVLASTTSSVFFAIGSSKPASRKDFVNVKEVAEYAKANNCKIVVTGYADSKTGSPAFNQKLSQKRAEVVADAIVKMGVSRDNIIVEAKGGVNNLSPYSYNRRVTVKLQ